jgi:hypothetical protein
VRTGFYLQHLKQYYDYFDSAQIRVHLLDDLTAAPGEFMRSVFEFIGVDPEADVDTSARFNTQETLQIEMRLGTRGLKPWLNRIRRFVPAGLYAFLYRGYSRSAARVTERRALSGETRRFFATCTQRHRGAEQHRPRPDVETA